LPSLALRHLGLADHSASLIGVATRLFTQPPCRFVVTATPGVAPTASRRACPLGGPGIKLELRRVTMNAAVRLASRLTAWLRPSSHGARGFGKRGGHPLRVALREGLPYRP
jgi:hypothetical protein